MTAQQLKNSILQMAVQGKLVAQNPNDESAKTLLERIQKEKAQLVKDKKIKKDKVESHIFKRDGSYFETVNGVEKCIDEELPFTIPESWEWCRLGSVLISNVGGGTPSKSKQEFWNGSIPWASVKDLPMDDIFIDSTIDSITQDGLLNSSSNMISKGDVIVCTRMGLGKIVITNIDVAINQDLRGLIFAKGINDKYFVYYYKTLIHKGQGLTVKGITVDTMNNMLFPLPPLEEQKRIVAKIEEVLPHIQDYEKAYSKIETLNKDFPEKLKKSVLQWAVQGKLVAQDSNDESAKTLLERIQKEKAQLVKDKKIKKDKVESHIFNRDGSYFEQVNGVEKCIDEELPFAIPESWVWVRIGDIFNLQAGKFIDASKIASNKTTDTYPCYGGNGLRGFVSLYNRNGDFPLIGRQGALCGNINRASGKFYATEHAVVVETFQSTNVAWACTFLSALNLNQYATATAQPGLAVSKIDTVLIPLPPLAEQDRIVAKIEEVLEVGKRL